MEKHVDHVEKVTRKFGNIERNDTRYWMYEYFRNLGTGKVFDALLLEGWKNPRKEYFACEEVFIPEFAFRDSATLHAHNSAKVRSKVPLTLSKYIYYDGSWEWYLSETAHDDQNFMDDETKL